METKQCEARVVWLTHPEQGAQAFARRLVEQGLVACMSCHTVQSVYRWQGRLEQVTEVQFMAKTCAASLDALEEFVKREHPFDVPEFIVLLPLHVEARYGAWLEQAR